MNKKFKLLIAVFLSLSFLFVGCSNSSKPDAKSINMACAFVEGYLDYKAFALIDLAKGKSARDSIDYYLSPLLNEFNEDLYSKKLFNDLFEAMNTWGSSIDLAYAQSSKASITDAATELEEQMDSIAIRCENLGWRFKSGWRQ